MDDRPSLVAVCAAFAWTRTSDLTTTLAAKHGAFVNECERDLRIAAGALWHHRLRDHWEAGLCLHLAQHGYLVDRLPPPQANHPVDSAMRTVLAVVLRRWQVHDQYRLPPSYAAAFAALQGNLPSDRGPGDSPSTRPE